MEHNSREQRRRETAARLLRERAELSTTALGRVPRMAATSIRGGVLALVIKVGRRPGSAGNVESIYRIVESLGRLKGVAMKMGQHLSYVDSDISDEVRAALAALQTHSPPLPVDRVVSVLRSELGPNARALIDTLEPEPIAAASIGQVHRAKLPDGRRVAIKVQYPGIASAIASDFGPASLAGRLAGLLYPGLPVDGLVREARARALDECDYRAEARHQQTLAARLAGHPVIAIPEVHEAYSTGRVLVTELVEGVHLDAFLASAPSEPERARFGNALFEFYVGSLVRWNLLSGDPHPGNYLFGRDGRVAILDHACTRTLSETIDRFALANRVFEVSERAAVYHAASALGSDALLLLRLRFGLAAVLAQLGVRANWPELLRAASVPWIATRAVSGALGGFTARPVAFEVVLLDAGERKIELVRQVRELTGSGITEAMELVDSVPWVVRRTADRREAEDLKRQLEVTGATVELTER